MMGTPFSPEQLARIRVLAQENGFAYEKWTLLFVIPPTPSGTVRSCWAISPADCSRAHSSSAGCIFPPPVRTKYADDGLYGGHDFMLTNSSGAFGSAIAEQLVMGTLMLLRRMPEYLRQQKEHIWQRARQFGLSQRKPDRHSGNRQSGQHLCPILRRHGRYPHRHQPQRKPGSAISSGLSHVPGGWRP